MSAITRTYPVGACAGTAAYVLIGTDPDDAVAALPKGARNLQQALAAAGWDWVVTWQRGASVGATLGAPFVVVTGKRGPLGDDTVGPEVRGTWHTRRRSGDTVTPRPTLAMFSLILRRAYRGWQDYTLRDATEYVTGHPVAL